MIEAIEESFNVQQVLLCLRNQAALPDTYAINPCLLLSDVLQTVLSVNSLRGHKGYAANIQYLIV